jgi:acetylglutamate kinase
MEELLIVKIGGNIIDDQAMLEKFLSEFAALPGPKMLVHGGGKLATEMSHKLGIETKMADGRRITDEDTLRVVAMVYAGWINKTITASLNAKGCPAIGLCGADAQLIPAVRRPVREIDYGHVGDLLADRINTDFISQLFTAGITSVIAPITSDADGHLLNVNADTVAQSLAEAMSGSFSTTLIYCFEKKGILADINDGHSVIPVINSAGAEQMKKECIISKGMIPKIDNALRAVNNGVTSVVIGHAADIAMIAKKEKGYGTHILK